MNAHPDVHNHWRQWSEEERIHLVLPYSNAPRWRSRREHYNKCYHHLKHTPNVIVYRVELQYGERPFEVTGDDPNDVQLRTDSVMFHKENMINIGVRHFAPDWKWGGYWDGDFHTTRHDWALEAIHLFQHHSFVQFFSCYTDLSAQNATSDRGHRPYRMNASFAWNYMHQKEFIEDRQEKTREWLKGQQSSNQESSGRNPARSQWYPKDKPYRRRLTHRFPFGYSPGAAGGGWGWSRSAFDAVGGLPDFCILGSGDEHTSMGLIGADNVAAEMKLSGEPYIRAVRTWQEHAHRVLNAHPGISPVGCVDQFAVHMFHGSKHRRGYGDRRLIFKKHDFNPQTDLVRDWQGLWRWAGNKPGMRDDVWQYFLSRAEDDPTFTVEQAMV